MNSPILRNLNDVPAAPAFWTREQTGGEACPWLLFGHKHAYIRATRDRFGEGSLSRMFCVPHSVVASSARFERVLLLLAVALMEAMGIHVKVCDDPAYSDVEGFVLSGHDKAIIANWVRGDGIWHVDTARRPSVLSDFREASGHASAHSVIEAETPAAGCRRWPGISTWTGPGFRTGAGGWRGWEPLDCCILGAAISPRPGSIRHARTWASPR